MTRTVDPIEVLLVDSGAAAETLAAAVEEADDRIAVDVVASADDATERVARGGYDCVVAAHDPPDRDGTELLGRVRDRDPGLPVLLCGNGRDETAVLAHQIAEAVESRHAVREAERRRDRLERFVEVVSHDLRTPLNVAQGRLELAADECDTEHLAPAADAVDRSLALVTDLLTLAREGEAVTDVERIDLASVTEACWATVETTGATLAVDTDRAIRGHRSRVRQLVENLIGNAVRHGGDDVTVTVGTMEPMHTSTRADAEHQVGFYVADDGSGIPPERRDQVFDTGYTTASDGTGFGLDIAREIAEAHGWTIEVVESHSGGARFEITGVDVRG